MLFLVGLIFSDFLDLLFYYFIFFWFLRLILFHYSLFHGLEPKPGQKMIMKSPLQNHIPLRCGFAFSCGSKKNLNASCTTSCTTSCTASCVASCTVSSIRTLAIFSRKTISKLESNRLFFSYFFSGIFRNIPLCTKTKIIQDNIQKNIYNCEKNNFYVI